METLVHLFLFFFLTFETITTLALPFPPSVATLPSPPRLRLLTLPPLPLTPLCPYRLTSEHDTLISMTVDQSKGWYYRFQDPTDEFYSSGWAGTTNRCGVNGGVQLHHLDNVRNQSFHWTNLLIGLTHSGAHRSLTDLQAFGILQVGFRITARQNLTL